MELQYCSVQRSKDVKTRQISAVEVKLNVQLREKKDTKDRIVQIIQEDLKGLMTFFEVKRLTGFYS